jgi:hypothetical protein
MSKNKNKSKSKSKKYLVIVRKNEIICCGICQRNNVSFLKDSIRVKIGYSNSNP